MAYRPLDRKSRAALVSVGSNTVLVALKLAVGIFTGSVGVISEAIHSGIDLIASAMALWAVRAAAKPADDAHAYGHGKYENLSGAIEAALTGIEVADPARPVELLRVIHSFAPCAACAAHVVGPGPAGSGGLHLHALEGIR